ncbi:Flp family type IVb pilin [Vibrio parahaemolyticus]|uniref:Flp family type IVb pilin n=2 Tax=Vibrio parahaemolyticus TaxID=670 RepID=A0A7Y0SLP8_VIBPH|nr:MULTISPECIES: Flp family type IVb pilin [Vibrio]BDP36035.1 fimbrial protein [Vibrio alginolyticus]EGR1224754.1 Flp family type IVb pilin [Vibrio parahaemolyticus]EHA6957755.1 Flp family type IVb pilin [Vibrio parahaemolyticus]EHA6972129.1 Flp family type IVb pilin [Vibrio parahaemolyticus]EHY9859288.1 Flp family type IVb pilin [Vibrio parahaemolyticus]
MITKLYVTASNYLNNLRNDERGVTAIEYGLIAIAMATMLALVFYNTGSLVDELKIGFDKITSALNSANN